MLPRTYLLAAIIMIPCLAALSCAGALEPAVETVPLSADQVLRGKAEILRAEELGMTDPTLLSIIAEQSPELRAMAARAMGRIGEPAFLLFLEKWLRDPDQQVRAEAAFALGLIGDSAALQALSRADADDAPAVRKNVASALGLLHGPASRETIVSLLGDPEPEVVAAACYALPLFDKAGFALDPLLALIDGRGAEVGMAALRALAWVAADHTLLGFEERMRAREHLTTFTVSRLNEARSLAALGLAIPAVTEEAELLGRLADEDGDPRVRFNAIRSLSFPGAPVEPFVSKALESENDFVVLAAVQGLGMMKGPEALEALARIVVFDSRWWLRKLAIAMTGRVNPSRAAAMANGLSKDAEPEVREAAARLLEGQTDELSISIAERLLADEDLRVRAAAIPVLAGAEGTLTEIFGETLNDDEALIRMALADAADRRMADPGRSAEEQQEARSIIQQLSEGAADPAEPGRPLTDYVEILRWAEMPRAAVITVERPGFRPGMFTVRLDTAAAPLTSWHFARLSAEGYYDGRQVNRVVPGLLVQSGGDEVRREVFHAEISPAPFDPGRLGMVTDGQWFISLATQPLLSPDQTAFGTVVQNFSGVVSLLLPGDRIVSVRVYEGDGSEELELP